MALHSLCVTAMVVTNEQIAAAVERAPDVIRASLQDTELFLKDAQRQINYNVQDAADTALERIKADLEGECVRRTTRQGGGQL